MASDIAKGTGTIIPPAPPTEGMQVGDIRLFFRWAQPKIPVQRIGLKARIGCRHGTALGPDGAVGPYLYFRYGPYFTVIDPFLYDVQKCVRATLVAHLTNDVFIPSHLGEGSGLADIMGHWFLNVNMFSALHGEGRCRRVHVIGGRNGNRVNIFFLVQHFTIVRIPFGLRKTFDGGFGRTFKIYIAEGDHFFTAVYGCIPDITGPFSARADSGQDQLIARCQVTDTPKHMSGNDENRGGQGSFFNK